MKKIVSLVLTIVLMVSVFAMLGTVTASAETYEIAKELVNLTFEGDAPYGIPAHRNISQIDYRPDVGYVMLKNAKNNGSMAFIGKDGTVGANPVLHTSGAVEEEAAYKDLFIFEANKTYEITFDYKYLVGTGVAKVAPSVSVFTNPLWDAAADSNPRDLATRTLNYSYTIPTVSMTLTEGVLAEDTDWYHAKLTFTTKEDEQGFAFGLYAGYSAAADIYMALDNFKIKQMFSSYTYTDTGVYTMENEPFEPTVDANGVANTTITYETDAEKGNVVKIVGANGGRAYIPGTPRIKANTKYYVSFDAKGIAEGNYLNLGIGRPTNNGACRIFFMGFNDADRGGKLYINGKETTIEDGFYNVKTKWQSYGFVIDTANETFLNDKASYEKYNSGGNVFTELAYFTFGAQNSTVYFDNVKIVEMTEPTVNAVPEKDASAKYSIRKEAAGLSAGLRFRGDVDANVKVAADEIGFVVAPSELVFGEENWYKVDSLNKNAKKAVAYNGTKDVVYSDNGDTVSYQLILTNLGNLASRRFAAVMYVKTGDTYTYISLGEISYNAVEAEYAVRGY